MYPPSQTINMDLTAVSGLSGSISLACWIVVFSPQILENFRRGSTEGLSIFFVMIWLTGDVFNVMGAVLQGVLPTMIILAVYYMLADIVLLSQCFYYRGFSFKDEIRPTRRDSMRRDGETRPLLANSNGNMSENRRRSRSNLREELLYVTEHGEHFSPAVPFNSEPPRTPPPPRPTWQTVVFNIIAVLMVISAGVIGWFLSNRNSTRQGGGESRDKQQETLRFNIAGQVFGYICAAFYLGSRFPQLLLNYRRKSTEGIAMLFFLFACIGNLTYVLSIFAYEPVCKKPGRCEPGEQGRIYGRYILVNCSWLVGSIGTLLLDFVVLGQFFVYGSGETAEQQVENEAPTLRS